MAIQTTRWTPDTCPAPSCSIDYQWDDSLPVAQRVHTPVNISQVCSAHKASADKPATLFSVIQAENTMKNKMATQAALVVPGLDPATVAFSFDQNRKLAIFVPNATAQQVATLNTFANLTYPGLVAVAAVVVVVNVKGV